MKNIFKQMIAAAALLGAAGNYAKAQTAPDAQIAADCAVGVTTNYTAAGTSQNRGQPSDLVDCTVKHNATGVYGEFFSAKVDPLLFNGSSREIDANIGMQKKLGQGFGGLALESFLYPGQSGLEHNNDIVRIAAKYSRGGFLARYSNTLTTFVGIPGSKYSGRIDAGYRNLCRVNSLLRQVPDVS